MSTYTISSSKLDNIANAINTALGASDTYTPDEMATAIGTIGGATLCGMDFTTEASESEGVSFYYSDTTTLIDSLPSANGIDTSLVTNERLNIYVATPLGAGTQLEIEFGDITGYTANNTIVLPACDGYTSLRTYTVDSSGNLINDSLSNVGNISNLANNTLKIKGEFYMFSNSAMQIRYKVYIGSSQIDTFTGELGTQVAPMIVSGVEFPNVGTDALNIKLMSVYVKGV